LHWWLKRLISLSSHYPIVWFGIGKEEKPMRVEEKKTFILTKHVFSFFFYLDPSYFQSSWLSYFFFILNDVKCYRSTTLSSTNSLGIIIAIEKHKRKFLGVQELVVVCSFEFLTPLLWGAITFTFLIRFSRFLMLQMRQEEGFNICLDTKNKRALPLDLDFPKCLSELKLA
jgi:hypothetical protein